ncbi:hypothetical protein C2869_00605 [Saccharobesus litoralis]|uniref:DUF3095 domain-containing protein n=1 Tax=Saccharobesus litoralis TaxID=2172099 RepID=A0A2S0VLE6_9ALTE|nr:DUF3095 domain-containing protein [Saccharobesus litoralis]AWB65032.1 hypothetical protein C2869_00605 [Saccharobesus litoralis]
MSNDSFYQDLPGFERFNDCSNNQYYSPLPDDWIVIVTDVVNSTKAIEQGKYKQVNAVGVASIVALFNSVKPLTVPYVFGGDGASICVPNKYKKQVVNALSASKQLAANHFNLELRVGIVPIQDIRQRGKNVLVAKFQPYSHFNQALFIGNGLAEADKMVKQQDSPYLVETIRSATNDLFDGFECRWNEIPSRSEEQVAILIQALSTNSDDIERTYQQILTLIRNIYGEEEEYRPLASSGLSLTNSSKNLYCEASIRNAFSSILSKFKYLVKLRALRLVGIYLMKNQVKTQATDWGQYKQFLIKNTDFQKFDDMLRMVISGSKQQRLLLLSELEKLKDSGQIVFGLHAAPSALITCMVQDYHTDHVHFLDVSNGGYAMAAKQMKNQMKQSCSLNT